MNREETAAAAGTSNRQPSMTYQRPKMTNYERMQDLRRQDLGLTGTSS